MKGILNKYGTTILTYSLFAKSWSPGYEFKGMCILKVYLNLLSTKLSFNVIVWEKKNEEVYQQQGFFSFFLFFVTFHFLCLCRPSEANLQLQCQPCWLPKKELTCSCKVRDAGLEPGTAEWQSGALPMSHQTPYQQIGLICLKISSYII